VLAISLVCASLTVAQAQIRTDGTLRRPAVGLTGPSFLISEALGRLAGSNLFYSFQVFNVGNAESATFVTTTAGLTNVISRVTGGNPSWINGLVSLRSTNAAPNFFFINSAGVVFGQGAQINVPAGFHASTANYCSRRARRLQPRTAALVDLVQPLEASLQSPPNYSQSPNAPL